MRAIAAIAMREVASMFRLPVGWVVVALFLLLTGSVFALTLQPGQPASLRDFFTVAAWMLMPVAPAVSMRTFSEEHRTGTSEMLLTAPVSDAGAVLGKFAGCLAFLLCMLAPTLVFPVVLWMAAAPAPDAGPIVAGYLSLVLQGSLYLALGVAISALTSSQTLAYLATLFPIMGLLLLSSVPEDAVPGAAHAVLSALAIAPRSADFARGVIDSSHVVFFLSAAGACLFAAHTVLESRRWR